MPVKCIVGLGSFALSACLSVGHILGSGTPIAIAHRLRSRFPRALLYNHPRGTLRYTPYLTECRTRNAHRSKHQTRELKNKRKSENTAKLSEGMRLSEIKNNLATAVVYMIYFIRYNYIISRS